MAIKGGIPEGFTYLKKEEKKKRRKNGRKLARNRKGYMPLS